MPCNAVAVIKAYIANKAFTKVLTPQVLKEICEAVLRETGLTGTVYLNNSSSYPVVYFNNGGRVRFQMGRSGEIEVLQEGRSPSVNQFVEGLKPKMAQVGAALLNQEIARILTLQGGQEVSVSYKPNGVAVTQFKA